MACRELSVFESRDVLRFVRRRARLPRCGAACGPRPEDGP